MPTHKTQKKSLSSSENFVLFEDISGTKGVRRQRYNDEWYYAVVDIVSVLMESDDGIVSRKTLKQRLEQEGNEVIQNCVPLKFTNPDGNEESSDAGDMKTLLRIIQATPTLKAGPLGRWLRFTVGDRKLFPEKVNPDLRILQAFAREIKQNHGTIRHNVKLPHFRIIQKNFYTLRCERIDLYCETPREKRWVFTYNHSEQPIDEKEIERFLKKIKADQYVYVSKS